MSGGEAKIPPPEHRQQRSRAWAEATDTASGNCRGIWLTIAGQGDSDPLSLLDRSGHAPAQSEPGAVSATKAVGERSVNVYNERLRIGISTTATDLQPDAPDRFSAGVADAPNSSLVLIVKVRHPRRLCGRHVRRSMLTATSPCVGTCYVSYRSALRSSIRFMGEWGRILKVDGAGGRNSYLQYMGGDCLRTTSVYVRA